MDLTATPPPPPTFQTKKIFPCIFFLFAEFYSDRCYGKVAFAGFKSVGGGKKIQVIYIYSRAETMKTNSTKFDKVMLYSFYKHSE